MTNTTISTIQFELPSQLACPLPTEERGVTRDQIRLLVTSNNGDDVQHSHFSHLGDFLQAGDLLVVNTSATLPAAIPLDLPNGKQGVLHLSNKLPNGRWLVEIRAIENNKTRRWKAGEKGMYFQLPHGGHLKLIKRFYNQDHLLDLWEIELSTPDNIEAYLMKSGQAIKYNHVQKNYPLDYYQTCFSSTPGSAEMPSAARGFTPELVSKLLKKGVDFAPILLHTGVSSLEIDEKPYPEYMEVSELSARKIRLAKTLGHRIVAVGTTAVRAVESSVDERGVIQAFKGHTSLFIHQDDSMKVVDALLTGFHEPMASHLHILQALVSDEHLEKAYTEAIDAGYFWHEFGDLHLLINGYSRTISS